MHMLEDDILTLFKYSNNLERLINTIMSKMSKQSTFTVVLPEAV